LEKIMIPQTNARILIVDDERLNIEILSDLFGDDHEILFATEGKGHWKLPQYPSLT